jgi:hypothetical protein
VCWHTFTHQAAAKDLLLILTEHYKFAVLEYAAAAAGVRVCVCCVLVSLLQ